MPAPGRCVVLAVCAMLMTIPTAHAENRSFADLLAQAKAQAAAGHRWDPPGDNAAETIMHMIDLIPTATPAQLSDLSALIESGRPASAPTAATADPTTDAPPPATAPAASPSQPAAPPPTATAAPDPVPPAPPQPAVPMNRIALGQAPPNQAPLLQLPLAPVPPAPTPSAAAPAVAPEAPSPPHPGNASRAAVLFAHGLEAEHRGDFSGARRFYATAAEQGDAAAARNLGRLYDPAYLKQAALGGIDPDPALARYWYERAVRLGDAEAGPLLEALLVR